MHLDIHKGKILIPPKGKQVPSHSSGEELQELRTQLSELELRNNELIREQAAMAHARNRYADLFEFIPAGCLALNSKGSIDEINQAGLALLGVERNKLLHQPFSNFVVSGDADLWLQYFKQAKQSGQQQSCELALKHIDGTVFNARLDSGHAEAGDEFATFIVFADITNQKRREKETMEWRNEMAELRKMQIAAQTATAIAHELNQPLLAIASYSEAALTLLKDGKPEMSTIIKAINGCERQAHRAGNTIHELLDFLSLKEVPAESFDLNKTISDVVNTAKLEHELQFDFILSLEDRLPSVFANRFHIEKVLFNLLRNGIEAMHEAAVPQPAITVTVCTKIGANVAQVTIQDNGPGIKDEHLHLLFKPFFTTKPKAIGMGLAVSRSLIEANGGQLWIDPAEGAGAAFHLTLPFAS